MKRLVGLALLAACVAVPGAGCTDKAKQSATLAKENVSYLAGVAESDVGEVERGLPLGAQKMTTLVGKEPAENPNGVRSALLKIRQQVPDLGIAKSTFFAFTDAKGIAIRNDLETDTMAGKDLASGYPDLKKLLGGETFVATTGQFGTPNPQGPDREWVAGVPVKKDDGGLAGLLVTGWTYRRFSFHLQEMLKRDLQDKLLRSGDTGKLPVVYVFLFDKDAVYGNRETPPVDETALKDQHIADKAAAGPADGTVTITDRGFGWAAQLVPKLGPGVGVAVLRSEI